MLVFRKILTTHYLNYRMHFVFVFSPLLYSTFSDESLHKVKPEAGIGNRPQTTRSALDVVAALDPPLWSYGVIKIT